MRTVAALIAVGALGAAAWYLWRRSSSAAAEDPVDYDFDVDYDFGELGRAAQWAAPSPAPAAPIGAALGAMASALADPLAWLRDPSALDEKQEDVLP